MNLLAVSLIFIGLMGGMLVVLFALSTPCCFNYLFDRDPKTPAAATVTATAATASGSAAGEAV